MKRTSFFVISSLIVPIITGLSGCKQYDNFTTYFNTYYNANRLMNESEDEFQFQDEKKRVTPKVFVPNVKFKSDNDAKAGVVPFMEEFIVSQQKIQPVKIKLDSIIIKGSKILARHSKSNFIESTLFLMAKSFFYQSLWLPSQIKCSELIERYPDGELVPDALLLLSKSLLMQQNYPTGSTMLSRTVDMAWSKKRWDILSEAFRIQAEVALLDNDIEGALRPYRQAIAQSEDEDLKAKWQIDMAAIYYRESMFVQAEKAFAKVQTFSPDYLAEFEGYLYQAICLIRLGQTEKADKILKMLENDGKYQEWQNYILFARMTKYRLAKDNKALKEAETKADSSYMNNTAINAAYYEKAISYFNNKNYTEARRYFSRSRTQKASFQKTSNQMFFLLNSWDQKRQYISPMLTVLDSGKVLEDSTKMMLSQGLFELGRIHEELGNSDSVVYFYQKASMVSPPSDTQSARYIYAFSRVIRDSSQWKADSLLEILADKYPKTEYGKDAINKLGYTKNYVIDEAADLFSSGNSLRKNKEYEHSKNQFLTLVNKFPDYKLSPKALYTIGWMYENETKNQDSALFYYKLLIAKYPNSVYAQDILAGVNYLSALRNGATQEQKIPDSYFKAPALNLDEISNRKVQTPAEQNPNLQESGKFNPLDIIKDPGKALNSIINTFKDEGDKIKKQVNETIDEVKDPSKLIQKMNVPKIDIPGLIPSKQDSTKSKNDSIPSKIEGPPK